ACVHGACRAGGWGACEPARAAPRRLERAGLRDREPRSNAPHARRQGAAAARGGVRRGAGPLRTARNPGTGKPATGQSVMMFGKIIPNEIMQTASLRMKTVF